MKYTIKDVYNENADFVSLVKFDCDINKSLKEGICLVGGLRLQANPIIIKPKFVPKLILWAVLL